MQCATRLYVHVKFKKGCVVTDGFKDGRKPCAVFIYNCKLQCAVRVYYRLLHFKQTSAQCLAGSFTCHRVDAQMI